MWKWLATLLPATLVIIASFMFEGAFGGTGFSFACLSGEAVAGAEPILPEAERPFQPGLSVGLTNSLSPTRGPIAGVFRDPGVRRARTKPVWQRRTHPGTPAFSAISSSADPF